VDVIAKTDMESDDATIREREDGDFARDVWVDRAGDLEFASDGLCRGLHQRKATRAVDVDEVGAANLLDLCGGRSFRGFWSRLVFAA